MTLEDASAFAAARRTAPPPVPDAATGSTLTPREREIAGLVALGLSNRAIADRLVIAPGTVKIHVERILGKLGRTSRVQIATWAQSDRELAAGPGSQPPA
jgi:DNA-binding NarL/FixJ family response regulator